jgi:nitroreductase
MVSSLAPAAIVLDVETWDAIRARRNVRTYEDRAIPEDDLERILEAARRTPSSMNQQAWDFVVVTERDRLRQLAKAWRYASHVAGSAATIALVVPTSEDRDERDTFEYDIGQMTMSIMLAAADLGIGSGHASVGDQALVRTLLGMPEDRECAILVALGYPADRPLQPIERPNRRDLDDVVHRERW